MQPRSTDQDFATPADLAACRAILESGSRTFFAASLLLPDQIRSPAAALYAFCRIADDEVDLHGGELAAVAGLRDRLARVYAGQPLAHPVDRAFSDVVRQFGVPRPIPEALIDGLEWDARGRSYADLSALCAYAARVAGTVGAMMTLLMGARSPEVLARALDLGIAMQLTNIARDVGEDARAGRLYLPLAWLADAGVNPDAWLARPVFTPAIGHVVQRLLDVADGLYGRAAFGIEGLPMACRPGIHAARLLYAEIGREVARRGLDSVATRAVVPTRRKLALLGSAFAAAAWPPTSAIPRPPVLDEARFLVDAIAALPPWLPHAIARPSWWDLGARLGRALELFERLERRDQLGRPASGS